MAIQHLPYHINEEKNRFEFYENYWKRQGLELLLKHCQPNGKRLLDYGCGRGECLALAAKAGFEVLGTDVDPQCVSLAAQHGRTCRLDLNNPLAQFWTQIV